MIALISYMLSFTRWRSIKEWLEVATNSLSMSPDLSSFSERVSETVNNAIDSFFRSKVKFPKNEALFDHTVKCFFG